MIEYVCHYQCTGLVAAGRFSCLHSEVGLIDYLKYIISLVSMRWSQVLRKQTAFDPNLLYAFLTSMIFKCVTATDISCTLYNFIWKSVTAPL